MRPALTIENAQLKTVSVEIKALTVSGRQVTQSVFKQMVCAPLINDAGNMNGTPWGWVNYGLEGRPAHSRNVVWVEGRELRRCVVSPPKFGDFEYSDYQELCSFINSGGHFVGRAAVHEALLSGKGMSVRWDQAGLRGKVQIPHILVRKMAVIFKPAVYKFRHHPNTDYWPNVLKYTHSVDWLERDLVGMYNRGDIEVVVTRGSFPEHRHWERTDANPDEMADKIDAAFASEAARRKRHDDRWREIQDLPQLFIAV